MFNFMHSPAARFYITLHYKRVHGGHTYFTAGLQACEQHYYISDG